MTESKEMVKADQGSLSPLVKVIVKTEGTDTAADRVYTLGLDAAATLQAARPIVTADLRLGGRWSFVVGGAELAASAEAAQTVGALVKQSGGPIEVRREKPAAQRKLEEEAASLDRDRAMRDKLDAKRKEEEKEQREHLKLTRDALSALQNAMARPEALLKPEDVKLVFSAFKHAETLNKFGGSTGLSLRELEDARIEKIVRSLGLPRTTSRAPGDGAFLVNEFVAQLRNPGGEEDSGDPLRRIAQRHVVAVNEVETRVETFQEEWQKKACEAGFSQIAATLAVAYKSPTFKGALSANYGQTDQKESASQSTSEVVYLVGIQEVRKARVVIPPEMIVLSPLVEEQFAAAAAGGAEALRPLFDRHGYFVITEYTLGGKLYTSETETRTGSAATQASKFQRSFGAAVDAQGFGAQLEGSVAAKSEQNKSQSGQETRQSSNFHLSAKGGNVTDRHNPQQWITSLLPENWEVIAYGRLVPIFEFLRDPALRERCRQAVQQLAKASDDKRDAEEKAAARARLARWAVMSRSVADRTGPGHERHQPQEKGRTGRPFSEARCQVSTSWVDVPQGMYFKGAQLKVEADWLKLVLFVTDAERTQERLVESSPGGGIDGRAGDGGLYFDKTVQWIPPQQRIVGLRLRRLESPSNRVGLEIKLGDLDGAVHSTLMNRENNNHYDETSGCTPCVSPTTVPTGKLVTGVRLENLGGGIYGVELYTLPIP